jgi:cold shock CspA family protein
MQRGTIKKWFPDRGFGFAKPDRAEHDVFVHVNDITEGLPRVGAVIEFKMGEHMRRPYAKNVRVIQ